jgi:Alpha/beta hydrolase domain
MRGCGSTVTETRVTPVEGKPHLLLGSYDLAGMGYRMQEFFISGTASSYAPSAEADYTTRVVAVTPTDDTAFNGTVIVEWLNVSGGIDAPALWFMAHREILREGYAYVAVSAQRVGVDGGENMLGYNFSLKSVDPQRYSRLAHPGDAFCFDIYSQAGRLAREGDQNGLLGALKPEFVLAVGESQSAMFLTTYVNAVDHLAGVYDGFLVHSRFGPAAPLDGTTIFDYVNSEGPLETPKFREDLRVPLITVITETDLIGGGLAGYYLAAQPDNERLRVWEIPGTAHADNYTVRVGFIDSGSAPLDEIVAAYAPTDQLLGHDLPHFINFAPQHHYVLQAAVSALHNWVRTGEAAPEAPRLTLTESDPPHLVLDANGLAQGGIRTPWVDVPVAKTSGVSEADAEIAAIFGSGEPFDSATLARLYPGGKEEYLRRFTDALDQSIKSGFILQADRDEILELAAAMFPSP